MQHNLKYCKAITRVTQFDILNLRGDTHTPATLYSHFPGTRSSLSLDCVKHHLFLKAIPGARGWHGKFLVLVKNSRWPSLRPSRLSGEGGHAAPAHPHPRQRVVTPPHDTESSA